MTQKYSIVMLAGLLLVFILIIPVSTGYSKSPVTKVVCRNSGGTKARQMVRPLVLRSTAVLVEDQQTGELLVQKNAADIVPIASITKLMTAMVVLDADEKLDELLTIQAADIDRLRHSHSRLPVGAKLTRADALLIALMSSDNRAAFALARTYPGGVIACVEAMNAKARSLGLLETHFKDTTGLSSNNVSSARDLVRLVNAAYHYSLIREYSTCRFAEIRSGRRMLAFRNTNRLIQNSRWEIGLSKTGYTGEAGRCLVMQAHVARRPVLIVLLDSQGKLTRIGDANRIKKWLEAPSVSAGTEKG